MANTGNLWASGTPAVDPAGSFTSGGTSPANAAGLNDGINATWGSGDAAAVAWIEPSGFGIQEAIGSQPSSIDSVDVTVYQYVSNVTRITSITAQLTSGGALIGAPQNLSIDATIGQSDVVSFPGVTWAQLADLGVRITFTRYNDVSVSNQHVDAVAVDVAYTAAVSIVSPAAASGWMSVGGGAPDRITAITDADVNTYVQTGDNPAGENLALTLPAIQPPTSGLACNFTLSVDVGSASVTPRLYRPDGVTLISEGAPIAVTTAVVGQQVTFSQIDIDNAALDPVSDWGSGMVVILSAQV